MSLREQGRFEGCADFVARESALQPAEPRGNLVKSLLEMQSSINSRLVGIERSLKDLQANRGAVCVDSAMLTTDASTPAQPLSLLSHGDHLQENLLIEIGKMLDIGFQKQSAHLEKMLLESKCTANVEVEHVPLEAAPESNRDALHRGKTSDVDSAERRVLRNISSEEVKDWAEIGQVVVEDAKGRDDDNDVMISQFFVKGANPETFDVLPRNFLRWIGFDHCLPNEMPDTCCARATQTSWYHLLEVLLIVGGTLSMAIEANQHIKAVLQVPKGELSESFFYVNLSFNIAYAVDLLFRICVLRSWFLLSDDWGWNLLDVFIVTASFLGMITSGAKLGFLRSLRIIRAVRAARIIRVLRFFRELQRIMLSILACVGSLLWCFIFLALTMFVFSLLILQLLGDYFDATDAKTSELEDERALAQEWYGSLPQAMWSLLICSTGGDDWLNIMKPLQPAGPIVQIAFVCYIIFVTVGVMNVLTGVFLSAAEEIADRSLIVQGEEIRNEKLVLDLCSLFLELDLDMNKSLTWKEWKDAISQVELQNYLSAMDLDCTHAHLLFDLLDERSKGAISMPEFVKGLVRLKGNAKGIDARVIQRECSMMPKVVEYLLRKHANLGYLKSGTPGISSIVTPRLPDSQHDYNLGSSARVCEFSI